MLTTMSDACAVLFDQGSLPDRIQLQKDWGVLAKGQVITWSDDKTGWVTDCGRWIMSAFAIRARWGFIFTEVCPTGAQEKELCRQEEFLLAV